MSAQEYQADVKPSFKKPMDKPTTATGTSVPLAEQETKPASSAKMQQQAVEQAAGFGEALSSLLSTGGGLQPNLDKSGTYRSGAIKGMTEDQAVEYAKQQWEKAPKEIRDKYANRVQNRPTDSERMAAFNSMDQGAQARANINSLPGADSDMVEEVGTEAVSLMTDKTPSTPSSQTQGGQWKKPMDKSTKGAGRGY